jgi:hypothetical protein
VHMFGLIPVKSGVNSYQVLAEGHTTRHWYGLVNASTPGADQQLFTILIDDQSPCVQLVDHSLLNMH